MNCKRCGSDDVCRSRRSGLLDQMNSLLGRWPYRCEECGFRYFLRYRYLDEARLHTDNSATPPPFASETPGPEFRSYAANAASEGPEIAFQTHAQRPQAKIVLQADSHEQLNSILLALNNAVNAHQHASKKQHDTAGSYR